MSAFTLLGWYSWSMFYQGSIQTHENSMTLNRGKGITYVICF